LGRFRTSNDFRKQEPIYRGLKSIDFKYFKIIDSLIFLAMALSKLRAMFDIKETKVYFPHLFNQRDNMEYSGEIPDKKYYMHESIKSEEKSKFEKWWISQRNNNYNYNHRVELVKY
jgi:hypothetical protein